MLGGAVYCVIIIPVTIKAANLEIFICTVFPLQDITMNHDVTHFTNNYGDMYLP